MKKNSLQIKLNDLRKTLIATLSSNKLKAAILAPMALSLVACGNVSGGSDTPYEPNNPDIPVKPPVDPTKEVESRTLNSLSGTFSGTSANKKEDILNNSTFTINYNVIYTDGKTDTNITEKVGYTKLRQYFNEDVVSFSVNGDFSETNQTVDLIATINSQINTIISGIKNGNYKDLTKPSAKTVVELLKDILGAEYNTISENVSSGKITLTAQTIKAVGDTFSVLENDAKNGSAQASTEKTVKDNKDAFVAQAQNAITVSKSDKYTITYNKNFNFNGTFNLDEISLPANNGKGDFSNATLTNNGDSITIDELNNIRGSSLPKLSFTKISDESSEKAVYDLYKTYSNSNPSLNKLAYLDLHGDLNMTVIDGKALSGNSNYTLFTNDDKAKTSDGPDANTIKSLNADALVKMTNQLNIFNIRNMIISGDATTAATVNWRLINIVFEGDMSKIKNNFKNPVSGRYLPLYGIVYFKDKPYNNNNAVVSGQSVEGMLKLDNVQGVYSEDFKVDFSSRWYNVLDVRGASLNNYDRIIGKEIIQGGYLHAIYFNKDYISLENNQDEINELCNKFANPNNMGIINAYLGTIKVKGHNFDDPSDGSFSAGSRTPRTLKEFEYLGNTYDDGFMHFETSAKSSYDKYPTEFDNLSDREKDNLKNDAGDNQLAKNDRRIEFIDPETQKIIFSVVNDRQYNA